jgi:hypothetical protein
VSKAAANRKVGTDDSSDGSSPSFLKFHKKAIPSRNKMVASGAKLVYTNNQQGKKFPKGKHFTLNDMLKSAKIVEKKYIKPIEQQLLDQGMIPGQYYDNFMEGVENKYLSFHRKLDYRFNEAFGEKYHKYRQKCWKEVLSEKKLEGPTRAMASIKGNMFAVPEELVLLGDKRQEGTYMSTNYKVKLIKATYNEIDFSEYDKMRIASGQLPYKVSKFGNELEYNVSYESDWHIRQNTELDELKYIYKAFWNLSHLCKKNWLGSLLRYSERQIIDYRTQIYTHPDGMIYDNNLVLLNIENFEVQLTVEELLDWIEWSRHPGKEYRIGEPGHELRVLWGILLVELGADKDSVRGGLTEEMVDEEHYETIREYHVFRLIKDKEEDEIPEDWKSLATGITTLILEEEVRPMEIEVDTSDFLALIAQEDYEDDFSDTETIPDYTERFEEELPYDPNLHLNRDEYVSLTTAQERADERENPESDEEMGEYWETLSNGSEYIADQVPTELEQLGIDLIDNSDRSFIINPNQKRIEIIWGAGERRPRMSVNTAV